MFSLMYLQMLQSLPQNKIIIAVLITFIIFSSCSENPTEQKEEPCPPIRIVSIPSYDSPAWHPSGDFIGFNHTPLDSITYPYGKHCIGSQHFNYGSTGFWIINVDGTNMRRILPFKLQTPAWSPDGKWIAFVLPDYQIYKMPFNISQRSFDTTKIEQLTFEGRNFFPAWSPDEEWIAYDSNKDSPNGMNFIWKMKNDGSGKIRIVSEPKKGETREPSWLPDGNRIVHIRYSKNFNTDASEIFVMDENGNDVKRLTNNDYMDSNPKYSSAGTLIAYTSQPKGGLPQLWLLDLSNNENQKLTTRGTVDIFSWSPDGSRIVYTQHDWNDWTTNNGELWIINVKNKNERQLTFNQKRR